MGAVASWAPRLATPPVAIPSPQSPACKRATSFAFLWKQSRSAKAPLASDEIRLNRRSCVEALPLAGFLG